MQEKILLTFLKKEFFRIGVIYLKQKKCQKKTNFLNILRIILINNRWSDLKDEIEKMAEDEKHNEQPDKILEIVEEILKFNK